MHRPVRACASFATGVAGIVLLALGSCGDPARRPDVLLLLVDTLRADHLGLYGYPRPTSPELDRFAARAIVFEEVLAPASWTLPSVASLFTSSYVSRHGLRAKRGNESSTRMRADLPTLAEAFSQAGYRSVAVVANPWVDTRGHGLQRGFEDYQSAQGEDADALQARARSALEDDDPRPVFLYVHYMDVHGPYRTGGEPGEPDLGPIADAYRRDLDDAEREAIPKYLQLEGVDRLGVYLDAYDRGIRRFDAAFGRFVDWLRDSGRLENSVIAVVSDHGEEFLEHGGWHHGASVYQEQVRVPWILHDPAAPSERIASRAVSLVDVAPTLLARAGLEAPPSMRGLDQLGAVDPERPVYSETHVRRGFVMRREPIVAMQRGHRKWLVGERAGGCFDRARDPDERSPGPCEPGSLAELRRWSRRQASEGLALGDTEAFELDPGEARRLEALGYGTTASDGSTSRRAAGGRAEQEGRP